MVLSFSMGGDKEKWSLARTAIDSFGACMIVTMLLDFWRLVVGGVLDASSTQGLPWMN